MKTPASASEQSESSQQALLASYQGKSAGYFSSPRSDYVAALPETSNARILELGCGSGATGQLAFAEGKCNEYVGIEISPDVAAQAKQHLSNVIVGDIEAIDLALEDEYFDVLIMSEVLEHLRDPWAVVQQLVKKLKPGGMVLASSPNLSHHKIIRYLLAGNWPLTDAGVMDRTHLRWFTPKTFAQMFNDAGIETTTLGSVSKRKLKNRIIDLLTFGKASHLFIVQVNFHGIKRS